MNKKAKRPAFPARVQLGRERRAPAVAFRQTVSAPAPALQPAPANLLPPTADQRPQLPARARMVRRLAKAGITEPQVLHAMGRAERHLFIDPALGSRAYEDTALPIGLGQTISKPSMVARMVELLLQGGVREADGRLGRVLDVGTGCGYQALVLSYLASEVYSMERLRGLHEKARANLRQLRVPNIHLIFGDGMAGFASGAPYAGIIAAAGGAQIPAAWIAQLAVGGRLVAPVAGAHGGQVLLVVDKRADGVQQTVLEEVCFVPLKSGIA